MKIEKQLKQFVRKTRERLKRHFPAIYDGCFPHLTDDELLQQLSRHKQQLAVGAGRADA
jgi:hypothetical protein